MKTCRSYVLFLTLLVTVMLTAFEGKVKGQSCTRYQRTYASTQSDNSGFLLSSISGASNAVDGNPQTFSTISLLAVGNIYQQLNFSSAIPINTPVTVKIGSGTGLLGVGVGIKVQAYDASGTAIGSPTDLSSLLALLNGDNQQEIQISSSTTQIKSIRVTLSTTLALGLNLKIYDSYYNSIATSINCETILDELHGVENPLGLASFTGTVDNPSRSIDGDITTFAQLNATIGVAAITQQTIIFPSKSSIGDTIKVLIQTPGVLLNAQVLSSLSYSTYDGLGNLQETFFNNAALINISLLPSTTDKAWITIVPTKIFDRFKISLGGTVSLLNSTKIFEIKRTIPKPATLIDGVSLNSKFICVGQNTTLSINNASSCTDYKWYDAASGGNLLNTGDSFIRTLLPQGTYTYYVQSIRQGCSSTVSERVPITITVNPLPSAGTITGNSSVCVSQTTLLSNSIPGGTWTSNDLSKATVSSIGVVTGVATGSVTITYTVTDATTGCSNFTTKNITINPLPNAGSITGNSSVCVNQTITLSNAVSGGIWASTENTKATINSSGVVTGIAQGQTTITYTVTNAGCSSAAAVVITVNPLPNATIGGTATVCQGTAAQAITFTGSNGTSPYTFTYNINGGSSIAITTALGDNTITIPVSTNTQGTFTYNLLGVMDASSTQCNNIQTGSATIIVNPKPPAPHVAITTNSQY